MLGEVLFTVVHDNLKYVVNTDHLCSYKLWIKVYDGDNMKCNVYAWLLAKNGEMLATTRYSNGKKHFPSWKEAIGFYWDNVTFEVYNEFFTVAAQRKLDSYFKLKAFW